LTLLGIFFVILIPKTLKSKIVILHNILKHFFRMFSTNLALQWMPVDIYVGGIEHAILHLLYSRFITKFLYDQKMVNCKEPFVNLLTQGMVNGKTFADPITGKFFKPDEIANSSTDNPIIISTGKSPKVTYEKMSKSKYNGIDPSVVINEYGADTVRLFMLFKAPPEMTIEWDINAIQGQYRWITRIWKLVHSYVSSTNSSTDIGLKEEQLLLTSTHECIKQVTESLESHIFNVAIASLMKLSNVLNSSTNWKYNSMIYHKCICYLIIMIAPMAPHVSSELWELLSKHPKTQSIDIFDTSLDVVHQKWPKYDPLTNIQLETKKNGTCGE
jgi:leucyl-tRNA synthetase